MSWITFCLVILIPISMFIFMILDMNFDVSLLKITIPFYIVLVILIFYFGDRDVQNNEMTNSAVLWASFNAPSIQTESEAVEAYKKALKADPTLPEKIIYLKKQISIGAIKRNEQIN